MRQRLSECTCELHGEGTWEDIFTGAKGMVSTLAEMTLCRKVKIDHLCLPGGDDFWQRPKNCVIFVCFVVGNVLTVLIVPPSPP